MKNRSNRPSQPAKDNNEATMNLSDYAADLLSQEAYRQGRSEMSVLESCIVETLRHEQFERECSRKKLIPVACCDGIGPAIAVDRKGKAYVQLFGEAATPEQFGEAMWWYRQILNDASRQGVTIFPNGQRKFLLTMAHKLS